MEDSQMAPMAAKSNTEDQQRNKKKERWNNGKKECYQNMYGILEESEDEYNVDFTENFWQSRSQLQEMYQRGVFGGNDVGDGDGNEDAMVDDDDEAMRRTTPNPMWHVPPPCMVISLTLIFLKIVPTSFLSLCLKRKLMEWTPLRNSMMDQAV